MPAAIAIMPLAEMERRLILAALDHTGQDVPRAASLLEINPLDHLPQAARLAQCGRAAG